MAVELVGADPRAALAAVGQATGLLRARGSAPTRYAELTPAEERVVVMAASGVSNRDIAERLFLSPRTVECHLSHAYAKLGVRSKAELAAWWGAENSG
jgi:DNA-binding CsgD family transcriptional regulator